MGSLHALRLGAGRSQVPPIATKSHSFLLLHLRGSVNEVSGKNPASTLNTNSDGRGAVCCCRWTPRVNVRWSPRLQAERRPFRKSFSVPRLSGTPRVSAGSSCSLSFGSMRMSNHLNLSTPAAVHGADVSHVADGSAAPAALSRSASRQPGRGALSKQQRGYFFDDPPPLAALLAIGTIAVVQHFGGAVRDQFAALLKAVSCQSPVANRGNAEARAPDAETEAANRRRLPSPCQSDGNRHE